MAVTGLAALGGFAAAPTARAFATPVLTHMGQHFAAERSCLVGDAGVSGGTVVASGFAVVGGHRERVVYVFTEPGGGWSGRLSQAAVLVASDGSDLAGSIAISGRTVVAQGESPGGVGGRGAVYVFTEPAGGWSGTVHEAARLSASDGSSLGSLAIDGQTVVAVGDIQYDGGGNAAYVFTEPAGGWSGRLHESARLVDSDSQAIGSVAISGQTIVATAVIYKADYGPLHVFTEPSGGWAGTLHERAEADGSWESVAISGQTIFAVAETGTTSPVYVFSEPAGGWSGALKSGAQLSGSDTGLIVSTVAASDQTVLASSGSAAYVFIEPPGGWASEHQSARLTNPSGDSWPVAISGPTVVVSAYDLAYVFAEPPTGWSDAQPTATIAATGARRTGNASLRGLAAGNPTLSLKLSTGCLPPTRSLTINLPRGLTFTHNPRTLARALHLTHARESRLIVRQRSLTVFPRKPTALVGLTIHAPGLRESKALRHRASTRRHRTALTLRIGLVVRDTAGVPTRLAQRVPAR